jgi:hypothetical protein
VFILIPFSVPLEGEVLQSKATAIKVYYPNGQTTAIKVSTFWLQLFILNQEANVYPEGLD